MKTLALCFLVLATIATAQTTGDPGLDAIAAYHAAARQDAQQRSAGQLAHPTITTVQFTDATRHQVTVLSVKPEGLVIQESPIRVSTIPKELLGMEDRVRFGYGTPEETLLVAKIRAERERARLEIEKLELMRRQTEAIEAAAGVPPPRETPFQRFLREHGAR